MVSAVWGDLQDDPPEGPHQVPILALGVDDDNIIVGRQGDKGDKLLHGEGLAGAGDAQDEAVGVEEILAVADQKVFADGVDAAVNAPHVLNLLDAEGHQGGRGLGGQRAGHVDGAQAIGQGGVKAVLLLVSENGEVAQGLGEQGLRVGVELFQCVGHVQQGHIGIDHALVPGAQIVQKFLGLRPLLFQLIGDHGGKVVPGVLPLLPPGNITLNTHDLRLHIPHRFVGGDREQVDGQHQRPGKVGHAGNHVVLDVTGILPHEQHPSYLAAQLKVVGEKLHAVRGDVVFEAVPQAHGGVQVKLVKLFLAGPEKIMEDA